MSWRIRLVRYDEGNDAAFDVVDADNAEGVGDVGVGGGGDDREDYHYGANLARVVASCHLASSA